MEVVVDLVRVEMAFTRFPLINSIPAFWSLLGIKIDSSAQNYVFRLKKDEKRKKNISIGAEHQFKVVDMLGLSSLKAYPDTALYYFK